MTSYINNVCSVNLLVLLLPFPNKLFIVLAHQINELCKYTFYFLLAIVLCSRVFFNRNKFVRYDFEGYLTYSMVSKFSKMFLIVVSVLEIVIIKD